MQSSILDALDKATTLSDAVDQAQTHKELAEKVVNFLDSTLGYNNTAFLLRKEDHFNVLAFNMASKYKKILQKAADKFEWTIPANFNKREDLNLLEKSGKSNKILQANSIKELLHPGLPKKFCEQLDKAVDANHIIIIPCYSKGYLEATVIVASHSKFSDDEERILFRILGKNVGYAVKNIRLLKEANRDKEDLIKILDNSLEGIIVYKDNVMYYASPRLSEITEYSIDELMESRDAMFLLPPEERKKVDEIARIREANNETSSRYETIMQTKTGSLIPVEIKTTKIEFKDEEMLMVNVRNLSKYKDSIEKLEKLYKEQGKIFAKIAHSLQTPFTVIKGMVELNKDRLDEMPAECEEAILTIEEEVTQASAKLADLLNVAKTDIKDINIISVPIHSKPFIEAAFTKGKALGYKYCKQNHSSNCPCFRLTKNIGGLVSIDPHAVMDVLMTLFDNAYKYTADKEGTYSITLSSEVKNKNLVIKVSDKGKGISKTQLKELFRPFSITRKYQTEHGIGLPLCKEIIESHNGTIDVESTLGHGSTFTITIPLLT